MALMAVILKSRAILWLRTALDACGALLVLVTFTPLLSWWTGLLSDRWGDSKGDVLIVLGADAIQDGMLGERSYWRSVYAVWTWRNGHFRQVVISAEERISEPIREFLICQGVPASAIRLEPRSVSTRENALYTAELLRETPGRKVLLTSDYHMLRARRAFEMAGLPVAPEPFPDAAKRIGNWRERWPVFLDLCMETVKVLYYRARGWI
jgi:uncharacterized SAM-binding protein YcdF (DUF218 family)